MPKFYNSKLYKILYYLQAAVWYIYYWEFFLSDWQFWRIGTTQPQIYKAYLWSILFVTKKINIFSFAILIQSSKNFIWIVLRHVTKSRDGKNKHCIWKVNHRNCVMLQNPVTAEISTAFGKLTTEIKSHDKDESDSLFFIFEPIILSSADTRRNIKKKRPALDMTYDFISKSEASSIYKETIVKVISKTIRSKSHNKKMSP